jgi:hypothetical protein
MHNQGNRIDNGRFPCGPSQTQLVFAAGAVSSIHRCFGQDSYFAQAGFSFAASPPQPAMSIVAGTTVP